MKNKVLKLAALDGSKWHIPVDVVVASYRAYYTQETGYPGDDEVADWAQNNMNWADVKAQARQVSVADPANMEDSWANGDMEVIEVDAPVPATQPAAAAPTSFAIERSMPNAALQKLFKNAGLVRGIETSIVLGGDADHLAVIQAIATDGLLVEATQERRLVLEAIRQACARTIALQQPAQVAQ
ncbi:hypothetical protein [Burkholderia ubonensis]|uniref:Uncharacterized protein n=1 Tax=Burkholderia ubonensis TaxID=101571 RepID=A0ABD4DZP6_9BURK|nr:hypothetical protein [Burkholderia ubonensis]KVN83458.1 hypothetical protein WJ68_16230 [Burkholderia ubonensis]